MPDTIAISLMFEKGLSAEERQQTAEQVGAISGVFNVRALSATAKNENVQRMYFAYIATDADIDNLLYQIRAVKNVENAEKPAPRYLC